MLMNQVIKVKVNDKVRVSFLMMPLLVQVVPPLAPLVPGVPQLKIMLERISTSDFSYFRANFTL